MIMGVFDIAQSVANVASDPCLMTVAGQLNRLAELEKSSGATTIPGLPTQASAGIGLCKAVAPLNFVIWARMNPFLALALGVGVVGGIFGLGYRYAKRG